MNTPERVEQINLMQNEVYIRSNTTKHFLDFSGSWCLHRHDARQFLTISAARHWCVDEGLVDVEIYVVYGDVVTMTLPVRERTPQLYTASR